MCYNSSSVHREFWAFTHLQESDICHSTYSDVISLHSKSPLLQRYLQLISDHYPTHISVLLVARLTDTGVPHNTVLWTNFTGTFFKHSAPLHRHVYIPYFRLLPVLTGTVFLSGETSSTCVVRFFHKLTEQVYKGQNIIPLKFWLNL